MSKISVIIPVYNSETYIEKCISSLINQSYSNFEVIVVDDGSTDQSISKAKYLTKNDDRFLFLKKTNGGQSSARNMGLRYAKGEYIAFIDSDDYIDPLMFEHCMTKLNIDPAIDIVIFGMQYINEKGVVSGKSMPDLEKYYSQRDILLLEDSIDTSMSTKVYKAKLFSDYRFVEGMIYEDQEILPKILYGKKITFIPYYLYFYVIHTGSTMRKYNSHYLESFIRLFDSHKNFLLKNKLFNEYSKYYEKGYILNFYANAIAYISLFSPDFKKDVIELIKSTDKKILTYSNIFKLLPIRSSRLWAISIFKISPVVFKYLFKNCYKRIKG